MSEQMARSKANDKSDPSNFPEDNGLRECKECGADIKVDLTNAKEAEVEEYDNCYQHLSTVEELREECFNKGRSIDRLAKELKEKDAKIAGLKKETTTLMRYFTIKDARIYELELAVEALRKGLEELRGM